MKIRITGAAAAVVVSAALVLSGCGSDDDASPSASPSASASASEAPTPTAEDVAAVESVEVSGDRGAEPKVTFDTPLEVSAPTSRVVDQGDGEKIADGMRVTIDYVQYYGDGTRIGSTWEQKSPESFTYGDASYDLLTDPLADATVGTRVLLASPSQDQQGNAATVLSLIEVKDAKEIPARASGEAVTPADGLPTVTLDDSGKPSIDIPEGYEAPDDLVVQPLIKGSGPEVSADQTVTVQYTGWLLDGTQFDSSWERGTPTSFPLDGVIKGWTDGLAGQTVGSQVLLVVPADQAYGSNGTPDGSVPPDSPLVFVVDILDAQ